MPEVFDHFYRLLGTSAAEQLDLITLDPGYRVYFEGIAEPLDISADRAENLELFEGIRAGSGKRLDGYLGRPRSPTTWRSATSCTRASRASGRCSSARCCRHLPKLARLLLTPLSSLAAAP